MIDLLAELPVYVRILVILLLAAVAHLLVQGLRRLAEWSLTPTGAGRPTFLKSYPRVATVASLVVSALTFALYFSAIGLVFNQFGISLTAYFASATIIGLAVGFGSQGLVQDVVTGLTLIFTDAVNVGNVVDIGGQTGRIEQIGLRFTIMTNFIGQAVFIPNRNITQINRYRDGVVRAYVDVQLPAPPTSDEPQGDTTEEHEAEVLAEVERLARGFRSQHPAVVRAAPELYPIRRASSGGWRYARVKLMLWPGQGPLVENTFRQRVLAAMRRRQADYADWMVTVTYRIEVSDQAAGGGVTAQRADTTSRPASRPSLR